MLTCQGIRLLGVTLRKGRRGIRLVGQGNRVTRRKGRRGIRLLNVRCLIVVQERVTGRKGRRGTRLMDQRNRVTRRMLYPVCYTLSSGSLMLGICMLLWSVLGLL